MHVSRLKNHIPICPKCFVSPRLTGFLKNKNNDYGSIDHVHFNFLILLIIPEEEGINNNSRISAMWLAVPIAPSEIMFVMMLMGQQPRKGR